MKKNYRFLPFRFKRKGNRVLLVNDVGDFYFIDKDVFKEFIDRKLDTSSKEFFNLSSKFMVCDDYHASNIDFIATRYRTKKQFLYDFTSLHMFVVTQRCNQKCSYCHASSVDHSLGKQFDMDIPTARKCVDIAFQSPSPRIKIEFQGGEPLLNFETVIEIVNYANKLKELNRKYVDFVICTNLTLINHEKMDFIRQNNINISTSLDGPLEIHDSFRKYRQGHGTYDDVIKNISWVLSEIGGDKISALMTITPYSIHRLHEVIDEYVSKGLSTIFLRMINPYGYAIDRWNKLNYCVEDFIASYRDALDYIIKLNLSGIHLSEEFATILLIKILTPFSSGFVDLQSPSGAGISGVIYETNGDVFIADEGRMLAKMNNDKIFCLGNVHIDSWLELFAGKKLRKIVESTCIEALSGCAWCVYQPYCGSDPIRNYVQFGNFSGNAIKSDFCKKHKNIFDILFGYLESDKGEISDVFWSWITGRNLNEFMIKSSQSNEII